MNQRFSDLALQKTQSVACMYVGLFLDAQCDAAILEKEWLARDYSQNKKTKAFAEALASGWLMLEGKKRELLRDVIQSGGLLFCFEKTTALQGGAA